MRDQFLIRACHRFNKMMGKADKLKASPEDVQLLEDLKRDMHWLIGVGGTYQLPVLTTLGEEGEKICEQCSTRGNVVEDDAGRLRSIAQTALSIVRADQEKS